MKRYLLFGLNYGIIWFCVVNSFVYLGLDFPIVEWTQTQYEAANYPEYIIIFGFRAMWGLEFLLQSFVAAMFTSLFIVKYYDNASNIDLVKISIVCILLLSLILYLSVPRFIPFYIGVIVEVSSLIICLLASFRCTKYITSC